MQDQRTSEIYYSESIEKIYIMFHYLIEATTYFKENGTQTKSSAFAR
jgi:hypothetical protein